ncbi:MAG: FAD:protein FMN transferase [Ruminococcus sp.]|nr:FAD:protein FMN transferase [Ruminococcus sp.]
MKKITTLFFLFLITLCGCANSAESSSEDTKEYSRDIFAMDTYMYLKAYGEHADTALGYSSEQILSLEELFSVTSEKSDIWAINHSNGEPVSVSDDTITVLNKAIEIGGKTNGALDVTIYPLLTEWGFTTDTQQVPTDDIIADKLKLIDYTKISVKGNTVQLPDNMQIDFGALAKGYTSDCVTEILKENGVKSALVNLGGNVHAVGTKPDGTLWKVGVQNPFSPSEQVCILEIADKAVITSGNYERFFTDENGRKYWHILDSADGFPADNGLVSVTIVGENGLLCDALSTALFVLGTDKAIDYWRNSADFEMILITDDEKII